MQQCHQRWLHHLTTVTKPQITFSRPLTPSVRYGPTTCKCTALHSRSKRHVTSTHGTNQHACKLFAWGKTLMMLFQRHTQFFKLRHFKSFISFHFIQLYAKSTSELFPSLSDTNRPESRLKKSTLAKIINKNRPLKNIVNMNHDNLLKLLKKKKMLFNLYAPCQLCKINLVQDLCAKNPLHHKKSKR